MSLRPANLTTNDYPLALSPTQGYEQQLYTSNELYAALGKFEVVGVNSGVATLVSAGLAQLAATPQRLLLALATDVLGGAALVVTVTGTDQDNAPVTGAATFQPPAWSGDASFGMPRNWGAEVAAPAGKKFKTITNIAVVADVLYTTGGNTIVKFFGVPDPADTNKYLKVGCKTQLNYDPKVPMPYPIQCGRDKGAFIKQGDIPVGSAEITAKMPDNSAGILRNNGRSTTGLIKELKNDKLNTQNIYLLGLITTVKVNVGEGEDPTTVSGTALYEEYVFVLAQ